MMNKEQEQKQEQITKKSVKDFVERYESLPSDLEKSAELAAHTVFIELILLAQIKRGKSKEEALFVIKGIADIIIKDIESEVI